MIKYIIRKENDILYYNNGEWMSKDKAKEFDWYNADNTARELIHDGIKVVIESKQIDDSIWKILRKERLKKVNDMSKWREIRCDFFNEEEEKYYVDAWKTGNDNEEGKVIAKIDLANGTVEYLDEDARTDEDAQIVINEFLENGYVLTEQPRNNDFINGLEDSA